MLRSLPRSIATFPLACCLVLALGTPAEASVQSLSLPIIGGATDASTTTVLLIAEAQAPDSHGVVRGWTIPYCSGVLVAPDVVLTAAHCTDPWGVNRGYAPVEDFVLYASAEADARWMGEPVHAGSPPLPDDAVAARRWDAHPGYDRELLLHTEGLSEEVNDIALVFLETPMGGSPARRDRGGAGAALADGEAVQIAGYGLSTDDWGPFGPDPDSRLVRRSGPTTITAVGADELRIGDAESVRACFGDSGGPAFDRDGAVVGIASRAWATGDDCSRGSVYTRVGAHGPWLDSLLGTEDEAEPGGCEAFPSGSLALLALVLLRREDRST